MLGKSYDRGTGYFPGGCTREEKIPAICAFPFLVRGTPHRPCGGRPPSPLFDQVGKKTK